MTFKKCIVALGAAMHFYLKFGNNGCVEITVDEVAAKGILDRRRI